MEKNERVIYFIGDRNSKDAKKVAKKAKKEKYEIRFFDCYDDAMRCLILEDSLVKDSITIMQNVDETFAKSLCEHITNNKKFEGYGCVVDYATDEPLSCVHNFVNYGENQKYNTTNVFGEEGTNIISIIKECIKKNELAKIDYERWKEDSENSFKKGVKVAGNSEKKEPSKAAGGSTLDEKSEDLTI